MPNEFIPKSISLRVIIMKNNSSEHKGYRANLVENNEENNLHYAIKSAGINELGTLSGCIYIDINESRQNPYIKLISVIHNLSDDNGVENHNNETRLVISYNLYDDGKPLNNWDNPDFFPIAFSALFLYGDGGHIAPRFIKVFLHTWAK